MPDDRDWDRDKKSALKAAFESKLSDAGFDLVTTFGLAGTKPQAIIYNRQTLELDSNAPLSAGLLGTDVGGQDPRSTLFEAKMIHVSGQKVVLASAHLDFNGDYSTKLRERSAQKVAEGAMYVWGSDTNHTPGHPIQGLTGDDNAATNYDAFDGGDASQDVGRRKEKSYDGLGFCPPAGYFIQSTEENGHRFHLDTQSRAVGVVAYNPQHAMHTSLVGISWMSKQSMVLDVLGYKQKIVHQFKQDTRGDRPGWAQV